MSIKIFIFVLCTAMVHWRTGGVGLRQRVNETSQDGFGALMSLSSRMNGTVVARLVMNTRKIIIIDRTTGINFVTVSKCKVLEPSAFASDTKINRKSVS